MVFNFYSCQNEADQSEVSRISTSIQGGKMKQNIFGDNIHITKNNNTPLICITQMELFLK